jgi:hypothetical protein
MTFERGSVVQRQSTPPTIEGDYETIKNVRPTQKHGNFIDLSPGDASGEQ